MPARRTPILYQTQTEPTLLHCGIMQWLNPEPQIGKLRIDDRSRSSGSLNQFVGKQCLRRAGYNCGPFGRHSSKYVLAGIPCKGGCKRKTEPSVQTFAKSPELQIPTALRSLIDRNTYAAFLLIQRQCKRDLRHRKSKLLCLEAGGMSIGITGVMPNGEEFLSEYLTRQLINQLALGRSVRICG